MKFLSPTVIYMEGRCCILMTPTSVSVSIKQLKKSYDAEVKNFLKQKQILAVILKSCVAEFKDESLSDIAGLYIEGEPEVSSVAVDRDVEVRDKTRQTNGGMISGLSNEDKSINEGFVTYDIRERIVSEHHKVKAEDVMNYDLMSVVILGLGDPDVSDTDESLRLLSTALSESVDVDIKKEILSDEFGIAMTEDIGRVMDRMCNLSSGIEERAEARGIEQGIEQGLEQKTVESMNNMIALGYPDDEISICLAVPVERVAAARSKA